MAMTFFRICNGLRKQIYNRKAVRLAGWFITLLIGVSTLFRLVLWWFDLQESPAALVIRCMVFHTLLYVLVPPVTDFRDFRYWIPGLLPAVEHKRLRAENGDLPTLRGLQSGTVLYRKTLKGTEFHAGMLINQIPRLFQDPALTKLLKHFEMTENHGPRDALVVHYMREGDESYHGKALSIVNTCALLSDPPHVNDFAFGQDSIWSQSPEVLHDEVLQRATEKIGEQNYNPFLENCQHLASYIATGQSISTGAFNLSGRLCHAVLEYYLPLLCVLDLVSISSHVFTLPIPPSLTSGDWHYWMFFTAYGLDTLFEVLFRFGHWGRRHAARRPLVLTVLFVGVIVELLVRGVTYSGLGSAVVIDCAIMTNLFSFYKSLNDNLVMYAGPLPRKQEDASPDWKAKLTVLAKPYIGAMITVIYVFFVG